MPRIRYKVAASVDGFIADRDGGYDWVVHDPDVDFFALFAEFDAFLFGRRTYEIMTRPVSPPMPPGSRTVAPDVIGVRAAPEETNRRFRGVSPSARAYIGASRGAPGDCEGLAGVARKVATSGRV